MRYDPSKTDAVGQEHPGRTAKHGERRLQLIGEQIDLRGRGGPQTAGGTRTRDRRECRSQRRIAFPPEGLPRRYGCDGVERRDQRGSHARIAALDAIKRDEDAARKRIGMRDTPLLATCRDGLALCEYALYGFHDRSGANRTPVL